jgi:plasmid replication initiation protein
VWTFFKIDHLFTVFFGLRAAQKPLYLFEVVFLGKKVSEQTQYEIKKAKLTGNEVVVQHNELVDAPRILNQQEQKLFMFLISKINPDDKEFYMFRVTVEEFAKAVGASDTKNSYRDLMEISKRLMSKVLTIHLPEEKIITQTNILDYIDYHYGKGYADIRLSSKLSPYLLGLRRDFTQYKLSQITALSSVYAIRIYEMLKKQEKFGGRTFFIDDLRKKLNIKDGQYARICNISEKVLEIAKREINEKTDILIDYKLIKTGRKFTAAQFSVKPKNEKKAEKRPKFLESYNNAPDSKYVRELMEFGFKGNSINRMLCRLQNSDIENAISAVKESVKKGKCKNPKAMLQTALKERWTPSNSATETQKSHPKSEIVIENVPVEENRNEEILETEKTDANVRQKKSSGFFSFLNKMLNK